MVLASTPVRQAVLFYNVWLAPCRDNITAYADFRPGGDPVGADVIPVVIDVTARPWFGRACGRSGLVRPEFVK
jgi:hypothetical protein